MEKLFSEFKDLTSAQWKEQIIKDLKGVDFDKLVWKTHNGFNVNPFYTSEDLKETKEPLFANSDWDICEQISVNDEKEAGSYSVVFDASSLSSGVYIYRITAMKEGRILFSEAKQMLLVK